MDKINNPVYVRRLSLLCAITYFASYLTRINFAAVTVEIIREFGWDKSGISAVTTALFITYGAGQLISGWLGDHTRPDRLMTVGLFSSASLNIILLLVMQFVPSLPLMTIVWGLNGFAQSMMWPPIVRILTSACQKKDYQNATVIVSWGSSIGTIAVFLLAWFCTEVIDWRMLFIICPASAVVAAIIWIIGSAKIREYAASPENAALIPTEQTDQTPLPAEKSEHKKMPMGLCVLLGIVLLAVIIQGALRDSIQSWLPNFLGDTFSLESGSALLTSVILPIFTTLTYPIVLAYYRRFFKSEVTCAATIFALSTVSAVLLYFISGVNPIISVLLLSLIATCMHGTNFLIIGLLPKKFERYGNVSTISGIINSAVYVGSSVSIWGIAVIAENYGWSATIITWAVLAAIGVVLCLSVKPKLKKYF